MWTPGILPKHALRLIVRCRKLTAQVTNSTTNAIVAMASSTEQEFAAETYRQLTRFPGTRNLWGKRVASRVGEKLGLRLIEIGVTSVRLDINEEISRPDHYRKRVFPLFDSLKQTGVDVSGFDQIVIPGFDSRKSGSN